NRRRSPPRRPTSTSISIASRRGPWCCRRNRARTRICRPSRARCSTAAPRAGSGEKKSPIVFFDLEEREEKTILDDAETFEVTSDGKKLLATNKKKYAVVDVKQKQNFD